MKNNQLTLKLIIAISSDRHTRSNLTSSTLPDVSMKGKKVHRTIHPERGCCACSGSNIKLKDQDTDVFLRAIDTL